MVNTASLSTMTYNKTFISRKDYRIESALHLQIGNGYFVERKCETY